ncbi:uncharacterized protein KQ657_004114 [Scheffersomyces spartinae]|uniref:Phosphoglycerate mutase n=1 Tax=Scheffersomyces spartinae TaxID=45513 RepID=A0A9P8AKC6_9ASCO|nr:uncharacterized protein KQ657_004114 [Scheffersomyces spartinae]KAG7195002.1 hypothetical protein KQ657_004114 [Scheffersomyces spartinae]
MTVSLLISNECDYLDAHGDQDQVLRYKKYQAERMNDPKLSKEYPWTFEVVDGIFQQSDSSTEDRTFSYVENNFGRLKSWQEISDTLDSLNANAASNVSYKLIFCARHGQGYHNYIVEKYGLEQWHAKWHCLGTDGEVTYGPDAMLTELGMNQAKENHQAWKKELALGAPIPDAFYVSPLQRSSWTLQMTWDGLRPQEKQPIVTENLRETLGVNLCDKRSTRLVIESRFKPHGFVIEEGFSEEDKLWLPDYREEYFEQSIRVDQFLQSLFNREWDEKSNLIIKQNQHKVVSTTSHAGTIRGFITVLGHRPFTISTGGMIPIFVKATRHI